MVKRLILFLLIIFTVVVKAQNLVPNPSFELYDTCPNTASQIQYSTNWFNPSWGSADYYNSCFTSGPVNVDVPLNLLGFQNAKTGQAYAGIFCAYPFPTIPSYREYIETKLTDSLQAGITYFITFYISLADSARYATDDLGVYFSNDSILSDTSYILPYTAQINNLSGNIISNKNNWTIIKGQYVASGGEKFMTIGNFKDNFNTDTLMVGGGTISSDYYNSYYYIDDICISIDSNVCNTPVGLEEQKNRTDFLLYPNPTESILNIELNSPLEFSLSIFNMSSILIYKSNLFINSLNQIDLSEYPSGVYFLEFKSKSNTIYKKIILTKKN